MTKLTNNLIAFYFMFMNCDFLFFRVSCVQQKIVNMFIYIPYARWLNIAQVFSFAHTGIESPCVIQLL